MRDFASYIDTIPCITPELDKIYGSIYVADYFTGRATSCDPDASLELSTRPGTFNFLIEPSSLMPDALMR